MGSVGASLGLYVGKGVLGVSLELYVGNLWGVLELAWGCMLATYRSYGVCWGPVWGCMLATCGSYGVCWNWFGAECWQPTGPTGHAGASLRL